MKQGVILLIGFILGACGLAGVQFVHGFTTMQSLATKYPGISFASCESAPLGQANACAYVVLRAEALRSGNKSLCQDLPDAGSCGRAVDAALALPEQLRQTCVAAGQTTLCENLVSTLLAAQAQNGSSLLPVDPAMPFGLLCAANDTKCSAAKVAFNKAVVTNSLELCKNLSNPTYRQQCEYEALFHQVFTSDDTNLCQAGLKTENVQKYCVFDYYLSRALAGDKQACDALKESAECKRQSSEITVGRFDYLKK